MNATTKEYKRLDFRKINSRILNNISSEDALKDITPICWSNDVLIGKKKVYINKTTKEK